MDEQTKLTLLQNNPRIFTIENYLGQKLHVFDKDLYTPAELDYIHYRALLPRNDDVVKDVTFVPSTTYPPPPLTPAQQQAVHNPNSAPNQLSNHGAWAPPPFLTLQQGEYGPEAQGYYTTTPQETSQQPSTFLPQPSAFLQPGIYHYAYGHVRCR